MKAILAAALVSSSFGAVAADRVATVAMENLPAALASPFRAAQLHTSALFDPLVRFDAEGRLQPALAISWENRDPLTWRLTLRPSVSFSNGTPLDAAAVVTAIDYLANEATFDDLTKREVPPLAGATAVDALTVDIRTVEPVPLFPRYATAIQIPEPHLWTSLGRERFARAPVGTGPFKAETIAATRWSLAANPSSWRAPQVDRLELLMLPDAAARIQALQSGRIDVSTVVAPDQIADIEASGGQVRSYLSPAVYGLVLITTRGGPLADVRVRRALNMAVDRERIITQLLAGLTVPANQPAARVSFGYDPEIPPYGHDPDAARALLAEAGYPRGFAFTLDANVGGSAADTSVWLQVQADLRAVGVAMEIRTMPNAVYLERVNRMEFEGDAFPMAWPSAPPLDVWRALQVHSCLRPVPWFCDQGIMPTLMAARTEWDESRALALRREVGRHYHDAAPALFLYELPALVGLGPRVREFAYANGVIAFDRLTVAD
ncbi:MAG: ABC transporter substrate-binding protein [Rhodospirillaceae bacterium]|nr:ABC transporter substrate-binding protein [Rhodospirillaceae bacterium]